MRGICDLIATANRAGDPYMRGMPYSHASRKADTNASSNDVIQEALAIHAANRPPKGPAKLMPRTPTLPKIVKNRKRRRTS